MAEFNFQTVRHCYKVTKYAGAHLQWYNQNSTFYHELKNHCKIAYFKSEWTWKAEGSANRESKFKILVIHSYRASQVWSAEDRLVHGKWVQEQVLGRVHSRAFIATRHVRHQITFTNNIQSLPFSLSQLLFIHDLSMHFPRDLNLHYFRFNSLRVKPTFRTLFPFTEITRKHKWIAMCPYTLFIIESLHNQNKY